MWGGHFTQLRTSTFFSQSVAPASVHGQAAGLQSSDTHKLFARIAFLTTLVPEGLTTKHAALLCHTSGEREGRMRIYTMQCLPSTSRNRSQPSNNCSGLQRLSCRLLSSQCQCSISLAYIPASPKVLRCPAQALAHGARRTLERDMICKALPCQLLEGSTTTTYSGSACKQA